MTSADAFPLSWPITHPRTKWRSSSRFKTSSFAVVRDQLFKELARFGATKIILSTNIPLRNDGLPYANYSRIQDPGVAVYFKKYVGGHLRDFVFACDRWNKIEDNLHAVMKTIDALRGIDRWGSSDMQERAFTGYMALPPASRPKRKWFEVFGVAQHAAVDTVKARRMELINRYHPDRGGDQIIMAEVNSAWEEFRTERGLR